MSDRMSESFLDKRNPSSSYERVVRSMMDGMKGGRKVDMDQSLRVDRLWRTRRIKQ